MQKETSLGVGKSEINFWERAVSLLQSYRFTLTVQKAGQFNEYFTLVLIKSPVQRIVVWKVALRNVKCFNMDEETKDVFFFGQHLNPH